MFKRRSQDVANGELSIIKRFDPIGAREEGDILPQECIAVINDRNLKENEQNLHYCARLPETENGEKRVFAFGKLFVVMDTKFILCFIEKGDQYLLMRRRSSAKALRVITTGRKYLVSLLKQDGTGCKVHLYAKEIGDAVDVYDKEKTDEFLRNYRGIKNEDESAASEEVKSTIIASEPETAKPAKPDKKKVSRRAPAGCRR